MKTKHGLYIKMAFILADESKCVSHHVGALIVRDGRIISSGVNGTPGNMPNCCDVFDKDNFDRKAHSAWSDDNEIHAEMNAIMFSARYPVEVEGCDMYTTLSPCNECLKNISMTGIKNVYYLYLYDRVKINPALLKKVNVQEVPGAAELKKWVEDRKLLYVPKQRQNG